MMKRINRLLGSNTLLFLAIAYSSLICVLFFIPGSGLPSVKIVGADKLVHGMMFFGLMILWQLYIFRREGNQLDLRRSLLLLGIVVLFGILIEVIQELMTATRTGDVMDIVADFVGALIAVILFQKIKTVFVV